MKLGSHDIDLVERGIEGSLNKEEQAEFDRKNAEEKDFREAVKFGKSMLGYLDADHKSRLKKELAELFSKTEPIEKPGGSYSRKWYLAAASVVILSGAVWVFQNRGIEESMLLQQYFEPYPNVLVTRSPELSESGFQSYSKGQFDKAISLFSKGNFPNDTLSFYLAMCYMSSSEFEKALIQLDEIDNQSIFYQQKLWYKSLTQIGLKRQDSAKMILEKFLPNDFKYRESQKILEQLD